MNLCTFIKKKKKAVINMIDRYGEIINSQETYKKIAEELLNDQAVGVGWTDEESTHFDIVFKLGISKYGMFQRGIKANYLYVSIIDYTSYAFMPDCIKHESYIKEKLRMDNSAGDKIAELINGIIIELVNTKESDNL